MLEIKNLNKRFSDTIVFDNFNASFKLGKVHAIMGASGVGKTTLLNIIAGLTDYQGEISFKTDKISYIFQSARLIEHMSVFQNIDYAISGQIPEKLKRKEIIENSLKSCEILHLKDKKANQLSGGEGQRVALARAMSNPCEILLMDEPFSSLDIAIKSRLIDLYIDYFEKNNVTAFFVTHSITEALLIADQVHVLNASDAKSFEIKTKKSDRSINQDEINFIREKIYQNLAQRKQ